MKTHTHTQEPKLEKSHWGTTAFFIIMAVILIVAVTSCTPTRNGCHATKGMKGY